MLQLVQIEAQYIKPNDLVFDALTRKLCKVEYVVPMDSEGRTIDLALERHTLKQVHVAYANEKLGSDTFSVTALVYVALDVDELGVLV